MKKAYVILAMMLLLLAIVPVALATQTRVTGSGTLTWANYPNRPQQFSGSISGDLIGPITLTSDTDYDTVALQVGVTHANVVSTLNGQSCEGFYAGANVNQGRNSGTFTLSCADGNMIQGIMYGVNGELGAISLNYDAFLITPTPGQQGLQGEQGLPGNDGVNGVDGINCWDLNSNHACDLGTEDKNLDGFCTALDCKGDTGDTGSQGLIGLTGAAGAKGDTGDAGPAGAKGDTGSQGLIGLTGAAGAKGDTGDAGPAGAKGDTGDAGPAGAKGDTGATGAIGPQGLTGETGATGPAGAKGDTGSQGLIGLTGAAGAKGDTGATGAIGPKGETGSDGKSAFQIAVEQGFTGNSAAWLLSLVGPIGPQGPAGAVGAVGPEGETGAQGPIGLTGPQGFQGLIGLTGPQGPAGANGVCTCENPIDYTKEISFRTNVVDNNYGATGGEIVFDYNSDGNLECFKYHTYFASYYNSKPVVLGKTVKLDANYAHPIIPGYNIVKYNNNQVIIPIGKNYIYQLSTDCSTPLTKTATDPYAINKQEVYK